MSQNISILNTRPGGTQSRLNLSAAALIRTGLRTIMRVSTIVAGTAGSNFTVNDAPVLVTAQTITGITAAAAAVITLSTVSATNPFAVGNPVLVTGAGGMTQINGLLGTVESVGGVSGAWTVTTNINSSAFSAWTSGGTAASTGAGNEMASIPYADLTVAVPVELALPCMTGLVISAVPTTWVGGVFYF